MKIATFNINGINARLPVLLQWLSEARPDVACLQELKAEHGTISRRGTGKGGLRRHLARPAPVERCRHPRPRRQANGNAAWLAGRPR